MKRYIRPLALAFICVLPCSAKAADLTLVHSFASQTPKDLASDGTNVYVVTANGGNGHGQLWCTTGATLTFGPELLEDYDLCHPIGLTYHDGALYGFTRGETDAFPWGGAIFRIPLTPGIGQIQGLQDFYHLDTFDWGCGRRPCGRPAIGADGSVFGMTEDGGVVPTLLWGDDDGVVFRKGADAFHVLKDFTVYTESGYEFFGPRNPDGSLILSPDGQTLYGTVGEGLFDDGFEAGMIIFKIGIDGDGYEIMHMIRSEASYPLHPKSLVYDPKGEGEIDDVLYGISNAGYLFRINAVGAEGDYGYEDLIQVNGTTRELLFKDGWVYYTSTYGVSRYRLADGHTEQLCTHTCDGTPHSRPVFAQDTLYSLGDNNLWSFRLPLGDFNGDGRVDQADYTTWADNFGLSDTCLAPGSSNGDGTVNEADYTTWADKFNMVYDTSAAPPPQGIGEGLEMQRASLTQRSMMQFDSLTGGPTLEYTEADLGSGLTGYTFFIANEDGLDASYAVTLAFEGVGEATIQQMLFYGVLQLDREQDATTYDGMGTPTYHKAKDSWAYEPFGANAISGISPLDESEFSGFVCGDNAYEMSLATGANSEYGDGVSVAYIVANGDVAWTGTIARSAVSYEVSGGTED